MNHEKDLISPFSDNILQSGRGMHHPSCSLIDIYLLNNELLSTFASCSVEIVDNYVFAWLVMSFF